MLEPGGDTVSIQLLQTLFPSCLVSHLSLRTPVQELWKEKVRGWCYYVSIHSVQLSG